jgi:5-methylcytosine-specific restriction endonuclease McrA
MTAATGWSGRRIVPGDWKSRRAKVLRRDGNACTVCGAPASEVDHVVPVAEGGSHELHNLAAICTPCHLRKTAEERARGRQRAAARKPRFRGPEPHPGAL